MFGISRFVSGSALAALLGIGAAIVPAGVQAADSQTADGKLGVVYHINDAQAQALGGLRNMRNHLDVAPDTRIVVVAHSDGIEFLRTEYEDAETVGPLVAGLAARGVRFEVCEITLKRQNLTHDDFVLEADFTPSGVARLAELQAKHGFAYIKP